MRNTTFHVHGNNDYAPQPGRVECSAQYLCVWLNVLHASRFCTRCSASAVHRRTASSFVNLKVSYEIEKITV